MKVLLGGLQKAACFYVGPERSPAAGTTEQRGGTMTYTISQAAEKAGISVYTLRYYDKEGLMPFLDKLEDGTRVFKDSDFAWLRTITCLKDTGMSIKEIREFVGLCMGGDRTLKERLFIIRRHQEQFERQMEQMERHRKTIQWKVRYYETAVEAGTEAIHLETEKEM